MHELDAGRDRATLASIDAGVKGEKLTSFSP
jgi:hypothetical protein